MGIKGYDRYKAFSPVPDLEKKLCKQWGSVYHTVWVWLVFLFLFFSLSDVLSVFPTVVKYSLFKSYH